MDTPSKSAPAPARRCAAARWAALAGCGAVLVAAPAALAEGPKVRTSDEAGEANLTGALTAPLRDINLVKDKVPKALVGAREAPYVSPENASCAQLAEMIAPLDAALGPDRGEGAKSAQGGAGAMVLGAVADATRDLIPFRGVVRRVTGASKHDEKVRDARQAGHLRRAYLKGFASAKGCYGPTDPDAAPGPEAQQVARVEPPPPQGPEAPAPLAQPAVQLAAATPAPAPKPAPAPTPAPAVAEAATDTAARVQGPLPPAPPVAVASLDAPPTAEPASEPQPAAPRFVLPESWQAALRQETAY